MGKHYVEDISEVIDLTISYCWCLDARDWEKFSTLFVPEATALLGEHSFQSFEAIKKKCSESLTPLDASHHMVTNHQVQINGDKATSRCYMQAQHIKHSATGGPNAIIAGTYEHELIRIDETWKIAHYVLTKVWEDGNKEVFNHSS